MICLWLWRSAPAMYFPATTWSPRSGTPPGSAMNASSMSTSATCAANSVPTLMTTGLSTPSAGLATGWGRHEPRTRSDLPILRRPGPGRRDQPGRGGRRGLAGGAITISRPPTDGRTGGPLPRAAPRRTGLPGGQPHHPGRAPTAGPDRARAGRPVAAAPTPRSPQDLTRAATSMAEGNYHLRVPAGETGPEVTTLARAFNTMATRLEHTEQVRRQMLSDLAHEMSTPLSVLVVYLDGLQDGVVEWNITTHAILAEQLGRLTRLIEDIDEVSRAQEHRIDIDLVTEPLGELIHTAATTAQESYQVKGVGLQATDVSPAATVT